MEAHTHPAGLTGPPPARGHVLLRLVAEDAPTLLQKMVSARKGLATFPTRRVLSEVSGARLRPGGKRDRTIPREASMLRPKDGTPKQNKKQMTIAINGEESASKTSCSKQAFNSSAPGTQTGVQNKIKSENSHSVDTETLPQNSHQNLNAKWPKVHQLKK